MEATAAELGERTTTPVELLCDLVFVFAVGGLAGVPALLVASEALRARSSAA